MGLGKLISSIFGGGKAQQLVQPLPLPQPPSISDSTANAEKIVRQKKASATKSIYTSPLGVAGEASVWREKLGQ